MSPAELRVALFSGNYNYVRDGANLALNQLVGHLLARGAAVRVYSPTTSTPAFRPTGDLVSVPAIAFPGREEYKLGRGLPRKTRADLDAFRPNLVHVSAPEFLGHRTITWARARGIPVIASLHTRFDTYGRYYRFGFIEPLVIRILRRFYNRANRVLAPTPSIAALAREKWGVTTPVAIWPRGVDHQRFNPQARSLAWRRSLGIADDEVAIGFLGRLVYEKGLGVFADVLAALQARGVRFRVLVVGEGPARGWFAGQVPEAAFAGFQSGDDLGRAVASMDVLFNPSVTETWGQVTSEAMAAAVPVVAARATGAVDLVVDGETGFLVPPGDIAGYAEAIARLVRDDALRRAAGDAGRRRAAEWTWEAAGEAALSAYLEVMRERRA